MKNIYYDGYKLLNKKDINGNTPEIFFCTSNRHAGKTTFFGKYILGLYKKSQSKFALIYRYKTDIGQAGNKFFKGLQNIPNSPFADDIMESDSRENGLYSELYLNGVSCGYAIALNSAAKIKNNSNYFNDVDRMLFDEFQDEYDRYCADEVHKFRSLHESIARGGGKMSRYVPVYMVGNPVSLINPYYTALGISNKLKQDTKFLRGNGFVLEQGYNPEAAKAHAESAFNRAFADEEDKYTAYSEQGIYLNDNLSFVSQPAGRGRYICTIRYSNHDYGIREYSDAGYIHVGTRADTTYPVRIATTIDDHNINYVMLRRNDNFISLLRDYFNHGAFRFQDLKCKEALLQTISYR